LIGAVKARGHDELVGPGEAGAAAVAASHVQRRRCDGGDRRGESLIESVNHIERGLRHLGILLVDESAGVGARRISDDRAE
jgi:hypothetical protein